MKNQHEYNHFITTNMRDVYSQQNCAHLFCFYKDLYFSTRKLCIENADSKESLERKLEELYKVTSNHFYELQRRHRKTLSWFQKFINMLLFRACKREQSG